MGAMTDEEWRQLQHWQGEEIRWLESRAETLERQLWRRTMAFGCAIAGLLGLGAGIGVFSALAPEPKVAKVTLPLPPAPPALPAVSAPQPEPPLAAARALPLLQAAEPAVVPAAAAGAAPPPPPMAVARHGGLRDTLSSIKERLGEPALTGTAPPPPAVAELALAPATAMLSGREPSGTLPTRLAAGGEPAAAPTEAPVTVTDYVNLRAAPDNDGRVLAVIEPGQAVRGTGSRRGGWLQVESKGGAKGWVYGRFLSQAEAGR